ncbi:hypothetical protein [uncultured Clostridium sp.]|nr:hypothetical protein [uncultured Clostridium sp.]
MNSIFSEEDEFKIEWRDNTFIINYLIREDENGKEVWEEHSFKIN